LALRKQMTRISANRSPWGFTGHVPNWSGNFMTRHVTGAVRLYALHGYYTF
jgi:hypothetical protein